MILFTEGHFTIVRACRLGRRNLQSTFRLDIKRCARFAEMFTFLPEYAETGWLGATESEV